ncbi:MAG: carbon monoxide dehydrogenase [Rhizobiaceae bacterium]|nr:MAG: carbon monoxide dehydrogenase [Rhizobiaceae bacterium]
MKPSAFRYERPASLDALFDLLSGPGDKAVLAGGQSLIPAMNFRMARPALVVDLAGIPELREIVREDGAIRIGATVTHAQLEDGAAPGPVQSFLRRVAGGIAFRAIRNRGTIGGSLAHADPAADWLTALSCMQAEVEIANKSGRRRVAMEAFVLGPMTTALGDGEIITAVVLPDPGETAFGWHKAVRKSGEFAEALAAVRLAPDGAECWVGAIESPVRLPGRYDPAALAGDSRLGGRPEFEAVRQGVREMAPDADDYAVQLAAVAVCRAIAEAGAGEGAA